MSRTLKAGEAEKFVEAWMAFLGYTVHRARRSGSNRDGKWFTQSHDIWGCIDLIGVMDDSIPGAGDWPAVWAIQVSTASGMTARRRKIEAVKWPLAEIGVSLCRVEVMPDPANRSRRIRHICTQPLLSNKPEWGDWTAEPVRLTGTRSQ